MTDASEEHAIDMIDAYDLCDRFFQRFKVDVIDATDKISRTKDCYTSRRPENYFPIQITSEGNRLVSNFEIEISSNHCLRQSSFAR